MTAERRGTTLHQTPIKAHFNEGKLITAPLTDAGWAASDANLCLYRPAGHNQSERKISGRVRRGLEGRAEFWRLIEGERVTFIGLTCCSYIDRQACSSFATAVVILGLKRLRPSDSCPAKGEVLPPV